MQEIEFYCKKYRKTMKMSYELTGDKDAPVMNGISFRCHTNKCTRALQDHYLSLLAVRLF